MELGFYAPSIGLTRPTAATITNAPRMGSNNNMNVTETVGAQIGMKGEFYALGNRRQNYDIGYSWSGTSFELKYKTYLRDRT